MTSMTTTMRTDRKAPYQQPTWPAGQAVATGSLDAGDRFVITRPLSDTASGHVGATGVAVWTNNGFPFVQLQDGTMLNLLEDDYIDLPYTDSARGTIPLITISHNTTMWNEGFEHDIYIQFPAADLEAGVRALVAGHNAVQTAYDRDFEVSVRLGPWEGPDLSAADARNVVLEALNEWEGI